jgi:RHS repeat-associated protein
MGIACRKPKQREPSAISREPGNFSTISPATVYQYINNPWYYTYCTSLPFGDALTCHGGSGNTVGSDVSPLHFTGKERDSESGLDNFGARYDSSSLGRFMSPDWSDDPDPVPYADLVYSSKFRIPQVLYLPLLRKHRGCGVFFPFWFIPERRLAIQRANHVSRVQRHLHAGTVAPL